MDNVQDKTLYFELYGVDVTLTASQNAPGRIVYMTARGDRIAHLLTVLTPHWELITPNNLPEPGEEIGFLSEDNTIITAPDQDPMVLKYPLFRRPLRYRRLALMLSPWRRRWATLRSLQANWNEFKKTAHTTKIGKAPLPPDNSCLYTIEDEPIDMHLKMRLNTLLECDINGLYIDQTVVNDAIAMCGLQNGLAIKRMCVSGPDGTFALNYRVTASEWLSQNLAIESFWSALLHLSMQYADQVCPSVHPDPAVRELMAVAEMMTPAQSMLTVPAKDIFDRSQAALLKRTALCKPDTDVTQHANLVPSEMRPYGEWEPVTEDNLPVIGEEILRYILPTDEDAGSRLLPYEHCVATGQLPNGVWFRRTAAYRECLMLLQPHRAVCYDLNDLVQIFVSACALNGNKFNKVTQQWLGQQWTRFDSVLIPVFGSASVIGFVSADSRMAIPLHVAAELIRVNDTNVFIDDRRPLLDAPLSTVIQFSGENYATKAKIFAMYENIALLWARHIAGQCVDTTR